VLDKVRRAGDFISEVTSRELMNRFELFRKTDTAHEGVEFEGKCRGNRQMKYMEKEYKVLYGCENRRFDSDFIRTVTSSGL